MKRGRGRMRDAGGSRLTAHSSRHGGSITARRVLRSVVDPGLLAHRIRVSSLESRVPSRVRSNEVVGADAPRANVERYKCARASLRL
ncbi:hypothetical protein ALC57_07424 [Trachymyrmex cornetzi]|uniref:Uncharacterized protein n=1 Tax=Trachymyrmex cornetzi TaxID=471704 RepID=A0A195E5K7_9HYME|nr:hypothetical protein ALC57_07424 [Trachymyrmex cornetzi]